MIITRTPLRISFFGGGTDLPEFYENYGGGSVLSATIDKYIYISVNKKFGGTIRLSYSETENVESVDEIKHALFREAIKCAGIKGGIEIVSIADVPGKGTGLGSSGAFLIGLLKALWTYKNEKDKNFSDLLISQAFYIERDVLGIGVGLQDYFSAVFGGLKIFKFGTKERIVQPVRTPDLLEKHTMLFYTGISRKAKPRLHIQRKEVERAVCALSKMRDQADEAVIALRKADFPHFGALLAKAWKLKKIMAPTCTTPLIDEAYSKAMKAGAWGGKICGAGGGGFMMIFCPPDKQPNVQKVLYPLREIPFCFSSTGSTVVYVD